MFKAVLLQSLVTLSIAVLALPLAGFQGAISVLLGGVAVVLPNLLFAARLWAAAKSGKASVGGFVVGEFFKVLATLALLVAVAVAYRDLNWLALLAGLFGALKANLLLIFIKV